MGDAHVGIILEMEREAHVMTKRKDVPQFMQQLLADIGRVGPLKVYHGDGLAAMLAKDSSSIRIQPLIIRWLEEERLDRLRVLALDEPSTVKPRPWPVHGHCRLRPARDGPGSAQ